MKDADQKVWVTRPHEGVVELGNLSTGYVPDPSSSTDVKLQRLESTVGE